MQINENQWKSMKIYKKLWKSMKIYENQSKSMIIYENRWKSMKIYENLWKSMKIYENLWKSMKINADRKKINLEQQKTINIDQKIIKKSEKRVGGRGEACKFQCASFSIRKNVEKWSYGRKNAKVMFFRKKTIFEKPHGPYQSCKKQKSMYNLIKFNQFNCL